MSARLRAGDIVEVRSQAEILETLDDRGELDGLPFMPEMFASCGLRFTVLKRAHKTCDTVFPVRSRRMSDAVHLSTRCSGEAHGGCEAGCLIFWKEAWLKRVGAGAPAATDGGRHGSPAGCSEQTVWWAATVESSSTGSEPRYACQATRLPYATSALEWWDVRQYVEDYTSGNVGLGRLARGACFAAYRGLINLGVGWGPALRWLYDRIQRVRGGVPYPLRQGTLPRGQRTPFATLDLKAGDVVRVKSYHEILATCDRDLKNRGMHFDKEMVPYCGGAHRVLTRVNRLIDEKTGRMLTLKTPSVILEGVACQSRYSECRLFCPRGIYNYWREVWLERIEPSAGAAAVSPTGAEHARSA